MPRNLLPLTLAALGALHSTAAYSLPHTTLSHRIIRSSHLESSRPRIVPRLTAPTQAAEEMVVQEATPPPANVVRVLEPGCPSCEATWLAQSKQTEEQEHERLRALRQTNMTEFMQDIWEYAQRMNDTQRQEVALIPDTLLRNFVIKSSTPPSPLMETVYNNTLHRVPYEQACYICGPEQAMLLRALVGLARPRRCLDIGSFTGYATSAVLEALPEDAQLTCLEVEKDFTDLAIEAVGERNVDFILAPAIETMNRFEEEGRTFDFITLDADKPMHGEYYNSSLRLLRPGGVLVMFGMLLFPTIEDQEAMEQLHQSLPNDTRISTAQLPVGCGMQLMVKLEGTQPSKPLSEEEKSARRKWQLESELAAIDRFIDSVGVPLGGAGAVGPGTEALTSKGLVAMQAARRLQEQALADMAAASEEKPEAEAA